MKREAAISHVAMARAGWYRVDPRPWRKTTARWEHAASLWRLVHCGHPTAIWPWELYSPDGTLTLMPNGRAWPRLRPAVEHVATVLAQTPPEPPPYRVEVR